MVERSSKPTVAPLADEDLNQKEAILQAFRDEFRMWWDTYPSDAGLIAFVRYEEVKDKDADGVIGKAEGLIIGDLLESEFGCDWGVLDADGGREFVVTHEHLVKPFNLSRFEWSRAKKQLPSRWYNKLRTVLRSHL